MTATPQRVLQRNRRQRDRVVDRDSHRGGVGDVARGVGDPHDDRVPAVRHAADVQRDARSDLRGTRREVVERAVGSLRAATGRGVEDGGCGQRLAVDQQARGVHARARVRGVDPDVHTAGQGRGQRRLLGERGRGHIGEREQHAPGAQLCVGLAGGGRAQRWRAVADDAHGCGLPGARGRHRRPVDVAQRRSREQPACRAVTAAAPAATGRAAGHGARDEMRGVIRGRHRVGAVRPPHVHAGPRRSRRQHGGGERHLGARGRWVGRAPVRRSGPQREVDLTALRARVRGDVVGRVVVSGRELPAVRRRRGAVGVTADVDAVLGGARGLRAHHARADSERRGQQGA